MESRQRKGLEIFRDHRLTYKKEGYWVVPSQSQPGQEYRVYFRRKEQACGCPDFELLEADHNSAWCKHIYAVFYVLRENNMLPHPVPRSPKMHREKRDWPAYNAKRAKEPVRFRQLLHGLCQTVKDGAPDPSGGRPAVRRADLVYAALMKLKERKNGDDLQLALKHEATGGLLGRIPRDSTILNFLNASDTSTSDILLELIDRSCEVLGPVETVFDGDSTHFKLFHKKRFVNRNTGVASEHGDTVNVGIICGRKTQIITGLKVGGHDSDQLPELIDQTAARFRIEEVYADSIFATNTNYKAAAKYRARLVTPFKKNATEFRGGDFEKAFHYYVLRHDEFWDEYRFRANVECVNSLLKRRHGEFLQCRTPMSVENEVMGIILIHNIYCLIRSIDQLEIAKEFDQFGMVG
jgi:hypothetical protein